MVPAGHELAPDDRDATQAAPPAACPERRSGGASRRGRRPTRRRAARRRRGRRAGRAVRPSRRTTRPARPRCHRTHAPAAGHADLLAGVLAVAHQRLGHERDRRHRGGRQRDPPVVQQALARRGHGVREGNARSVTAARNAMVAPMTVPPAVCCAPRARRTRRRGRSPPGPAPAGRWPSSRSCRGRACSSISSQSEHARPIVPAPANAARRRASFCGSHTSSWSASATTSPRQRRIAASKFRAGPSRRSFTCRSTGKGARAANSSTTATVWSVEPSSDTTSSSGGVAWPAMLSSCCSRKRAPW